jgi:ABC-type uncharacterized transport system involved in gliding motility auxiliary subunit
LYLSGLAALVAVVLYVLQRQWNLYLQLSLAMIVVGLALFAILDPERVRVALSGRQARYGSNALVLTLAFIGILVVVNYLVFKNSKRWDLTEDKQNTLAGETIATLEKLPDTVVAQAFFTGETSSDSARTLLDQYKFASDGKFTYEFIDPDANPVAARQAGVTRDGSVVLTLGSRKETITSVSENNLTSSMVRLLSNSSPKVYFLTGHGEIGLEGSSEESYATLKSTLENKNYQLDSLNLLSQNTIPADANVIVIAGPKQPVSQAEVDQLAAFVGKGGKLIVMEEPLPLTEFGDAADPLADYLASTWGITLGKDMVLDLTSQQAYIAVANRYGQHAITQKLEGMVSFFPTARSVQTGTAPEGVTVTALVNTSSQSWAETDLAAIQNEGQIKMDQGIDLAGPVPLAAAAENASTRGRVIVFGDADFATNSNFGRYGNGDLMVNSVDWVSEQENLINLTPKETTQRIVMAPQYLTTGLVFLLSVVALPLLTLVGGVVVWVQRRKRG